MISYFIAALFLIIPLISSATNGLSIDHYMFSCPFAESMVKNAVFQALNNDPTLAAALLRMHFHDCFIQGCDGSVLIDSTEDNTAEKDSPANLSLRGFEVIDDAKKLLEDSCPGIVSCADILAMAARDSVFFAGGAVYDIPKGRKDGRRSRIEDTINLPQPSFNASSLIRVFGQHGFSAQEMVALSGGHTLGIARCSSFKNRLSKFDPTHEVDPSLEPNFAKSLSLRCLAGDNVPVPFDDTPNIFDNDYFASVQRGTGLLFSDQALFSSPRTRDLVSLYGSNRALFLFDFQRAIIKMGVLEVKEEGEGEVRLNCRRIN
ncbi:peroxidase 47 [Phalaenopsis equestris]|uniref:peroxidase 47 n=1 Tax=Phalaenopsis equestris TaxID=78828 RepID=UPI0009E33B6B|nr:peroxidase 47 [Phalaenopsis equestris]